MKSKAILLTVLLVCAAAAALGADKPQISGQYLEARTADVYTGPCFANSEVNLAGQEAVLAWRIERGSWQGTALDGLAVVAVVRASSTLGDVYSNPLPAKAVVIMDERATEAQRAALQNFAHAQAGALLDNVLAVEVAPIRFTMDESRHGYAAVEAGNLARISTRAIGSLDSICHNEEVYYPPLAANLNHAMPAVATRSNYRGNHLGVNWDEANRRSAFLGSFAY